MTSTRRVPSSFARGAIYWCDLEPVVGSEQGKKRPVVIVSNDDFGNSPVRTVVPVTTREYRGGPAFVVKMHPEQSGLREVSWALANQIRTVATARFGTRAGSAAPEVMRAVDDAVRYALDVECSD